MLYNYLNCVNLYIFGGKKGREGKLFCKLSLILLNDEGNSNIIIYYNLVWDWLVSVWLKVRFYKNVFFFYKLKVVMCVIDYSNID